MDCPMVREAMKSARQNRLTFDPRSVQVRGFLIAKGFLRPDARVPCLPRARISLGDALWVGRNVDRNVYEVLPAAMLRFPKNFVWEPLDHPEIECVIEQLRARQLVGARFRGVSYRRLLRWCEAPLNDGRAKPLSEAGALERLIVAGGPFEDHAYAERIELASDDERDRIL